MASLNRGRMSAMTDDNERAMQMLVKLKNDINSIDAALPALKEECTLFQRNMYKNYSQHRRAAFYKHLQEVKRWLRDISLTEIKSLFSDTNKVLDVLTLQSHEHHISWKVLAGDVKIQLDRVLRRMMIISQDISQAIISMQKAYKGLSAQFSMTYFMPFALTMNSILARLTVLFKTILVRIIEGHGGVTLLYLNEVTKANPLRARVTAMQLIGYRLTDQVILVANI